MAQMVIAGESTNASDGATSEIHNPATGAVVDRVAAATEKDINRAIDAAENALKGWSKTPPSRRGEILFESAHRIKEREKELAKVLTQEQGKPMREAVLEVRRFVHTLEHYAGMSKSIRLRPL